MKIIVTDREGKIKGIAFNLKLINECLEVEYVHINSNLIAIQPFATYGEFIGNKKHHMARLFIIETRSIDGEMQGIKEYIHEETREGISKAHELIQKMRYKEK